jgi:hypothetical protein
LREWRVLGFLWFLMGKGFFRHRTTREKTQRRGFVTFVFLLWVVRDPCQCGLGHLSYFSCKNRLACWNSLNLGFIFGFSSLVLCFDIKFISSIQSSCHCSKQRYSRGHDMNNIRKSF